MSECVTHHHACDCREREFEGLVRQRDALVEALNAAMVIVHLFDPELSTISEIKRLEKEAMLMVKPKKRSGTRK